MVLGEAAGKEMLDQGLVDRVKQAIGKKDQTLTKHDLEEINKFLRNGKATEYRKLIDDLDNHQIEIVTNEVEAVIKAVQRTSGAGPLDPGNLDPENAHTREDYDVRAHTRGRPSR